MAHNTQSITFPARKAAGRFGLLDRRAFDAYTARLGDGAYEILVRPFRSKRSSAQNRRYWALLTVGAISLWEDPSEAETLHEELAHLLLALPPCEKTGLRRRMRTPKLNTAEFSAYMDRVVDKLIELGADLSNWESVIDQHERAA